MKLKISLILFFTATICTSCQNGNKPLTEHPVLKASLKEKQVSVYDIYKKAEIIPLETTQESSFRYPEKVEIYNDTVYIFDSSLNSLYIFEPDGKYVNKIHRVGQGPEEYIMAYDFLINQNDKAIEMLNPMGAIHKYKIDGTFIRRDDLPKPPMNYKHFELLDKGHYITWSSLIDGNDGGLSILAADDYRLCGSYFPNSGLWGAFKLNTVFHKYKDSVYYHESMANKVYRITQDGYQTAYEWDLGVEIIDPKRLSTPVEKVNEALMKLGEDFKDGKIPFCFAKQFQTDKYYYASLRFGISLSARKNLFYDKLTGESMLFSKTKEGIRITPVLMTDDYTIGILEYENKETLRSIVSPGDAALLDRLKEEDNTWLVKFIFK